MRRRSGMGGAPCFLDIRDQGPPMLSLRQAESVALIDLSDFRSRSSLTRQRHFRELRRFTPRSQSVVVESQPLRQDLAAFDIAQVFPLANQFHFAVLAHQHDVGPVLDEL